MLDLDWIINLLDQIPWEVTFTEKFSFITNYPIQKVNVCIMAIWRVHYEIDVKCDIFNLLNLLPTLP